MHTLRLVCSIVASAACLFPMAAEAALLAYDGFNYAPAGSDLLGNAGGFGFSTPWRPGGFNASINTNYDVQTGSLSFGGLVTSGHRVSTTAVTAIAGLTRDFLTPLGVPGTTRYASFLLRPEGQLNAGAFNGFFGVVLEQPVEPELFVGKPGGAATNRYVLEDRGGSLQVASSTAPAVGETVFLVLKAQFTAGNDAFTLYVNPTPGGPEPATGTVKNNSNVGTVAGLTLYSTGAFSIDEFRLGETFADVTPAVPEPATWLLALVALTLLVRRRG
ncbi:MAG TPA: PEP-CTERM sorting domain-containing protein [Lacipirellulaceae bacterium]|nr:PEP-CTERM sorting domain-containing protein [Lacipirellulaceae bacterium]